jgi:hypothetical protein
MSAEKVARLIADFDRPEPAKPRSRVVPFDHLHHSTVRPQHQPLVEKPRAPPPPIIAPEDEAYDRGLADGHAKAMAEFEQRLAQDRHAAAVEAEEERQRLLDDVATKLATDLIETGTMLQARIAGAAARILEPLVNGLIQAQAVAHFVEHLGAIATEARRPVLRLTGPSDLLDLIRNKLGVRAISVELRPGPEPEVSITIDQTVLETQLKVWTDRLKLAIQG